jgi:hypothetical protein
MRKLKKYRNNIKILLNMYNLSFIKFLFKKKVSFLIIDVKIKANNK